jgi:methionyl-tRNA formyltransferase
MKIVYFGNDFFSSCLKYLINEGFQIVRVYKNSPKSSSSTISKLCEKNRIPSFENQPDKGELNSLVLQGVDMFIVAEYLHILPEIDVKYAINLHPTRLPMGRGPTPLPYLIKYPEYSGITIHKLTNIIDGGDVIIQSDVPVLKNESITTLMVKLHIEAVYLLKVLLSDLDRLYKDTTPQINHSYWTSIDIVDRILDWKLSTNDINFRARSFGFLGLVVKLDNILWNAKHIEAVECGHQYEIGMVIFEDEYLLAISSNDGIVCIHKNSLSLVV